MCQNCDKNHKVEASISWAYPPPRATLVYSIYHCDKDDSYFLQQLDTTDYYAGVHPLDMCHHQVPDVQPNVDAKLNDKKEADHLKEIMNCPATEPCSCTSHEHFRQRVWPRFSP